MIEVSVNNFCKKFCKQSFVRTESVCTIAPFWGDKICGVDVLLNTANCGKCVT